MERDIYVWVGVYSGDDEAWSKYFDVDQYGSGCGFCRDTGKDWFDFDKFSSYNAGAVLPVRDVLLEVPFSEQFEEELVAACVKFGIKEASHCFTMIDFEGDAALGKKYNDLVFVGSFNFSA
ncbi:immunity 22 family protein [Xanthomonas oryzae]|uniref:immunity 22 family protein n=1 Tax=Xanthomonas oryzae TaxID=347 RepID=UPI0009EA19D9|nr:immunity 22 family protein [Xanthomonas oryzae]OWB15700.1 hypothetical protein XocBAI15_20125 [Xanthomonas oryzae pv. oryzicola]QBH03024.1 hypothetical protein EYC57_05740 [Xanthomonas oryzae]